MQVNRLSLTSRHAEWWLTDINPEHFDREYHSRSETFQEGDAV